MGGQREHLRLPRATCHGDDAAADGGSGGDGEDTALRAGLDVALHGVAHGGVRNGTKRFHFKRGAYNPVVSDGKRIYLVGYGSVTAMDPRKRQK